MRLYEPGAVRLSWVPRVASSHRSAAGSTLAYCAPQTGTYYLDVRTAGVPGSCRVDWSIAAAGVDVVPPTVAMVGGADSVWGWFNRPVPLSFYADDGAAGSGVASIEWSADGGVDWVDDAHPTIAAPADHSNDGPHLVLFRARDVAGNVSPASTCVVGIDTAGPVTQAWGPKTAVRRGAFALVRFSVSDPTEVVFAQLVVQSVSTGQTVKTVTCGWLWEDPMLDSVQSHLRLRCALPRGSYRVLIAGLTHDEAGNLAESATCGRLLRVT
jgi:hypothetical protein